MKNKFLYSISVILFVTFGCSGEEERQEQIGKLRAIGVEIDPFVSAGATATKPVANIKYILASNSNEPITAIDLNDSELFTSAPLKLTLDQTSLKKIHDGNTKVYSFIAKTPLPPVESIKFKDFSFLPLQFAAQFNQGSEEEKIFSRIIIYDKNSEEVKWSATPPQIKIDSLKANQKISSGEIDLSASITNRNGEEYKIGWFVSSGELKNRRAISTTWKDMETGKQTIIVTLHGKKTSSFAWQVIEVEVQ